MKQDTQEQNTQEENTSVVDDKKAKKVAAMAKARAAKAANKSNGMVKNISSGSKENKTYFWREMFLVYLRNFDTKGSSGVSAVIKATDDTIEMLKKEGKID